MNALNISLQEYLTQISELREKLKTLDSTSQEYKDTASQLASTVSKLDQALNTTEKDISKNNSKMVELNKTNITVGDSIKKMALNVNGLGPAFNTATAAGTSFSAILDVLKAHPIIAAMGILLGVFMKIKDAINGNEEASRNLQKAMSAFQPVISAIQNALGWLAVKLTEVALYISKNIPTALNTLAKIAGGFFDFMTGGIRGIATLMSKMPVIGDAGKTILSTLDNVRDKITSTIQTFSKTYSAASSKAMAETQKRFDLEDKIRNQRQLSAESELKQAELRDKIATSSGAERLKLLKQLRSEIETNGKREVEIAKEQLRLAEYSASLAPNSKEENDRLSELRANVTKTVAAYEGAFAKVDKMSVATTNAMTTAQKKAAEDAKKEQAQALKDYENDLKTQEQLQKDSLTRLKAAQNIAGGTDGKLDLQQQIDFENQRYDIISKSNEKINEIYKLGLDNEKITDEEKLKILSEYNTALLQQQSEYIEHQKTLDELRLQDIQKNYDKQFELAQTNGQQIADGVITSYVEQLAQMGDKDAMATLKAMGLDEETEQAVKEKLDLRKEDYAAYLQEQELEEQAYHDNLIAIKQAELDEIAALLGVESEVYQEHEKELTAMVTEENNRRAQVAITNAEKVQKAEAKSQKMTAKQYNAMASAVCNVLDSIASAEEDNIEQKLENGEISEEEAKKEFERVKALQIVSATISMIQGAVQAFTGAMQLGPIAGPIVGALEAAAITAMGIANINKIKSQQFNGKSASGGATPAQASAAAVPSVAVNPLLDEERDLTNMQTIQVTGNAQPENRVYILESDIQESNDRVEIRESQTTF